MNPAAASEQVFRRIVDQATDLIYVLDLELRVLWLNRHSIAVFTELLGSDTSAALARSAPGDRAEFFIGKTLDQLFREADADFVRRKKDELVARDDSTSYEHWIRSGGRKHRFSTKLFPIRDDEGEVFQLFGITRDVTDRHELDQRIYNAEKLASIGVLAAGVAHELNNPLAIILGFADLLKEKFSPQSQEHADLSIIEAQALHARQVVENILGFARVSERLCDQTDVATAIESVVRVVHHSLVSRKVELRLMVAPNLPCVCGDPREFQQVLVNLIQNSLSAMPAGGVLTVQASVGGQAVRVVVRDTGSGIPDRIRPYVFDPFFTTKDVGEGTGLGLSLCHGIVDKIGGKIAFSSVSEEDHPAETAGTTFEVLLPIAQGG